MTDSSPRERLGVMSYPGLKPYSFVNVGMACTFTPSDRSHQTANPLVAVAREQVNDGNLYHRVASRLLTHGSSGHADKHLSCEGGIVDAHVELEELVLRLA